MTSFTGRSWKCNIKYTILDDQHYFEHPPVLEIRDLVHNFDDNYDIHSGFQIAVILDFAHFLKD